jgi:hypothetical protein
MALRRDRWLPVSTLAIVFLAGATARAADEGGVWWETSVEMQGMGMAMPATKVCLPRNGPKEPPSAGDDPSCKVTDVKNDGLRMTWKMECTGKNAMKGDGEMTRTKDGYTGKVNMHMAQGDMVMAMTGKRLGGDCDPEAGRKQAAAYKKQGEEMQAQSRKAMAEACEKSAAEVQLRMFGGPGALCKEQPGARAKLREVLSTLRGYTLYQQQAKADPSVSAIYQDVMGSDPEADRAKHCKKAAADSKCDKTPGGVLQFLRTTCPAEMRDIAKQCCAGRDYSGVNEQWNDICTDLAKEVLGKGGAKDKGEKAEEPKSGQDQAKDQAKKLLKGLFGK